MTSRSVFGLRLWRLLSQRRPSFPTPVEEMRRRLSRSSGVPDATLRDLINRGVPPAPSVLGQLAPALGIHTADLFVIAGLPVPLALAAAPAGRPWDVSAILRHAAGLDTDARASLSSLVLGLPQVAPAEPPEPDDYPEGPGALLLRLLKNRGIRTRNAQLLLEVGGGPYVSDATITMLGGGFVAITPQYVTAFAHLLGYEPGDMVALTGVGPVFAEARVHPAAAELAALAWSARRLTAGQISDVLAAAEDMQR